MVKVDCMFFTWVSRFFQNRNRFYKKSIDKLRFKKLLNIFSFFASIRLYKDYKPVKPKEAELITTHTTGCLFDSVTKAKVDRHRI